MKIVETDGNYCYPTEVTAVVLAAGERATVVVTIPETCTIGGKCFVSIRLNIS